MKLIGDLYRKANPVIQARGPCVSCPRKFSYVKFVHQRNRCVRFPDKTRQPPIAPEMLRETRFLETLQGLACLRDLDELALQLGPRGIQ